MPSKDQSLCQVLTSLFLPNLTFSDLHAQATASVGVHCFFVFLHIQQEAAVILHGKMKVEQSQIWKRKPNMNRFKVHTTLT